MREESTKLHTPHTPHTHHTHTPTPSQPNTPNTVLLSFHFPLQSRKRSQPVTSTNSSLSHSSQIFAYFPTIPNPAPKSTVNHRTTRACLRWVAIRRHEYELLDERRRCRPQSQWRGLQPPQRP
ncbi:hypothetical protein O988_00550 [Pseudogymnoascus sp. VKM F-3808]|nr:hypothetical protein O988_00550 [Pseudogymnoascus sp. VKM F-3808]